MLGYMDYHEEKSEGMQMDARPIGVFDSGLGGLTTVKSLARLMPGERIIYLGDTGRVPYGSRSRDTIIKYARQDADFLAGFDIKAMVIASIPYAPPRLAFWTKRMTCRFMKW